jgi:hypothetical protein
MSAAIGAAVTGAAVTSVGETSNPPPLDDA